MANITKVYLLNVPIESDYKITLYFPDKTSQYNYFYSKRVEGLSYDNFSYQRKEGVLRVPVDIDSLYKCNYVMYQNNNNGKWFYAFIKDMEFKGDDQTNLTLELDVMQTWMFDYTVKPSFVEREHTSDDRVGINTIPENLEVGDYIITDELVVEELKELCYVILSTESISDDENARPLGTNFGGIFVAGGAYVTYSLSGLVSIINVFDERGKGDAIQAVYVIPKKLLAPEEGVAEYRGISAPVSFSKTIDKPSNLNNYIPKNNKLLTFPYQFMLMSNNNGVSNNLTYEGFSTNSCEFDITGIGIIGGSIFCMPKNYMGLAENREEGIIGGKFPTLSWSSDLYTNWLTQNSLNIGMGIASGALQIVGGALITAGSAGLGMAIGGGTIVGGVSTIANQLAQIHQMSYTPASAKGNVNGGDIFTVTGANTFHFYKKCIKPEYAKIIDDYFSMFGYKTNRVKIPNKNHRLFYWYTKTIDVSIDGAIPNNDLQKIKDCYNNGITFWRGNQNVGDYTVNNDIEIGE